MADTLDAAVKALSAKDEKAASAVLDRAEATEKNLVTFDTAAAEGLDVVRLSPFRRHQLALAIALSDLHQPLDLPAAICGCWFGDVWWPCGVMIRFRWPIKIWSDGWPKRADSSPRNWRNTDFPSPQGIDS